MAGIRKQFQENYIQKCLNVYEDFHLKYEDTQHHFTLYYYDQADSLVRTIPPAGVRKITDIDPSDPADGPARVAADMAGIRLDRSLHRHTVFTRHTMPTTYQYNSLNQLVSQTSPDVDVFGSKFWYDKLGRLVVSQNAKQYGQSGDHLVYSYTLYDALGRITEVGEMHAAASDIMAGTGPIEAQYSGGVLQDEVFAVWIDNGSKTEVTKTVYDLSAAPSGSNFRQENLRKRVSAMYVDNADNDLSNGYDYATYYSYDVHGNVKSLLQENPAIGTGAFASHRYKKIDYEYDLISGNVKKVSYQDGAADAFYHKYLYDADNRITHVYTSKDKVIWDEDAKYFYYKHGPLARTELGNEKVQGTDYAYTLQGWIKGINATNLAAGNDIAKDGEISQSTNANKNIARDVYSYSLNYYLDDASTPTTFEGDYKAIGTTAGSFIAATTSAAYLQTNAPNLYNGNISSMTTTILDNSGVVSPQLTAYKYDQLNRIKELNAYRNGTLSGNDWAGAVNDSSYHSKMDYDANGNILYMLTNGNAGSSNGKGMDELHYVYKDNTNRLRSVTDNATSTYSDDIKTQAADNYVYDAIGNLKHDEQEEIETIAWTVYGKIKSITRKTSSTKSNLEFTYDAAGNRTSKKEIPRTGDATTTYYVRDASGNVMATYQKKTVNSVNDLYLQEQDLFGSSRLGIQNRNLNLTTPPAATPNPFAREIGQKNFELSNHLGNVLSTVSDKRIPHNGTGGMTDYYEASVSSANDYYAFGAQMPGRGTPVVAGSYRYGFNGKEKDREVVGTGQGTQDYGMRIYNPSLGKFLSVDPLTKKYPELTPYQFASNRPIDCIDLDGLEGMGVVMPYGQTVGVDEPVGTSGGPLGFYMPPEREMLTEQHRLSEEEVDEFIKNNPVNNGGGTPVVPIPPSTQHFETDAMGGTRVAPNVYLLRTANNGTVEGEQTTPETTTNTASNNSTPVPRVNARAGGGAKVENILLPQQQQIQRMADKWQVEITVIGGRARGTHPESDWDYIVSEVKETMVHDMKFRLPKSPVSREEMGRARMEIFDAKNTKLKENLPHIKFTPNPPQPKN
jgi:RHS repeat-associated protein